MVGLYCVSGLIHFALESFIHDLLFLFLIMYTGEVTLGENFHAWESSEVFYHQE